MRPEDLIHKSRDGETLSRDELVTLLELPPDSPHSLALLGEALRVSKELTEGKAEAHAQFALNLAPCGCECLFCAFARVNGVFDEPSELSLEEATTYAKQFQEEGANAVFLMSTAQYPLGRFLEIAQEIRRQLDPSVPMIANVGDQSYENAKRLRDAGFAGVYHAIRMREGDDTNLDPKARLRSMMSFKEAGLRVGTCVEPVGPEHGAEELAEMIAFTASIEPAFSGAARRISIPGTEIAKRGMISELRMAQVVAATRLGVPRTVIGNCTHEPCTLGALGGANLFWAELGANPRDVEAKTEEGRGETVGTCRTIYEESGWQVWDGPSRYFS